MTQDKLYNPNYDYVSWISNVSGRLLFHLTDAYSYRHDRIVGDVIEFNELRGDTRIFCLSMLVDLRDSDKSTYKEKNLQANDSKYTRVVIISKVNNNSCVPKTLEGEVYLIDDALYTGLYKSKEEVTLIEKIQDFSNSNDDFIKLEKIIDNFRSSTKIDVATVTFKINESGFIYLKKYNGAKFNEEKSDSIDPEVKMAFFILKFTFHRDRYHSHSTENIVRVISYEKIKCCIAKTSDIKDKELLIAKKLLDGVKGYISQKRKNDVSYKEFCDLKGVINYTKTLTVILDKMLHKIKKEKNESKDFIEYEEKYLQNIDATLDRELNKMPKLEPKSFFSFLSELRVILFLPLFILSSSLLVVRLLNIRTEDLKFNNFVDAYIILIIVCILALELVRGIIRSKEETYLLEPIIKFPNIILSKIKKCSTPNILIKDNCISFKITNQIIFPKIIDIEMYFRRKRDKSKNKNKKNIYINYSFLLIPFIILFIFLILNIREDNEEGNSFLPKVVTFLYERYYDTNTSFEMKSDEHNYSININIYNK